MPAILHLSDLHFGPNHLPDRAEAARALATELEPDVVVVSGDLTRRANRTQFRAARSYLDGFAHPLVVVPGNHDVPLYRFWERFLVPHRNFAQEIGVERNAVHRWDDMTIVALDSTRSWTFTDGRLRPSQLRVAERAFATSPPEALRVVVTHHPLTPPPDFEGGRPMPGADVVLRAFAAMRVHIVLAGHLHRAYTGSSHDAAPGSDSETLVIQCGTTSCRRGRGRERGTNSLLYIRTDTTQLDVTRYMWRGRVFEPVAVTSWGMPPGSFRSQGPRRMPEGSAAESEVVG